MIIGVDPHETSHTATAVDAATNMPVSSLRVDASVAGYRQLLGWARQFGERRWAGREVDPLRSPSVRGLVSGMSMVGYTRRLLRPCPCGRLRRVRDRYSLHTCHSGLSHTMNQDDTVIVVWRTDESGIHLLT